MPRKVRQLRDDLRRAGCQSQTARGKGSHTYWTHPLVPGLRVTLSGADGDDAKHYQERDVSAAIAAVAEAERQARATEEQR